MREAYTISKICLLLYVVIFLFSCICLSHLKQAGANPFREPPTYEEWNEIVSESANQQDTFIPCIAVFTVNQLLVFVSCLLIIVGLSKRLVSWKQKLGILFGCFLFYLPFWWYIRYIAEFYRVHMIITPTFFLILAALLLTRSYKIITVSK